MSPNWKLSPWRSGAVRARQRLATAFIRGLDLVDIERLRDVIVGAEGEAGHLVDGGRFRTDEDDRNGRILLTDNAAYIVTGYVRHHDVEADEVRRLGPVCVQARRAGGGPV